MAEKNKSKNVKLSLSEYQKFKALQAKKLWRLETPWPVKIAVGVPAVFFLILLLGYIFYIRSLK